MASGSVDHTITIWNLDTGELLSTLQGHTGQEMALAVLSDGSLASASDDKTKNVWSTDTNEKIATLSGMTIPEQ